MTCPRCQGLMVPDLSCDLAETQGMWVSTIRCMNCGHVTDPTIEKHRLQSSPEAGRRSQSWPKFSIMRAGLWM